VFLLIVFGIGILLAFFFPLLHLLPAFSHGFLMILIKLDFGSFAHEFVTFALAFLVILVFFLVVICTLEKSNFHEIIPKSTRVDLLFTKSSYKKE